MKDPLQNFNWNELYKRYDNVPGVRNKFKPDSPYIKHTKAKTDRELYYWLIKTFSSRKNINLKNYKSLLYWKHYSRPAILGMMDKLPVLRIKEIKKGLRNLNKILLTKIPRDKDKIISLIARRDFFIYGMGNSSLPTRSTFLHFICPNVMPVFDKMVLRAVGVSEENANHNIDILKEYLPFAWHLAEKYSKKIKNKFPESPIRLIDMALWIVRGNQITQQSSTGFVGI